MLYFVLKEVPRITFFRNVQLNFFSEYHGKSEADGHFGVLSRWHKDKELTKSIKDVNDLILHFEEKAQEINTPHNQFIFLKFCPGSREPTYRKTYLKGYKLYLSYNECVFQTSISTVTKKSIDGYEEVNLSSKKVKDKRKTRVSLIQGPTRIMGPFARKATLERYMALMS